jgi:hypothetical protein
VILRSCARELRAVAQWFRDDEHMDQELLAHADSHR